MSKKNKKNQNDQALAVKDECLNKENNIEQQDQEKQVEELEKGLARVPKIL